MAAELRRLDHWWAAREAKGLRRRYGGGSGGPAAWVFLRLPGAALPPREKPEKANPEVRQAADGGGVCAEHAACAAGRVEGVQRRRLAPERVQRRRLSLHLSGVFRDARSWRCPALRFRLPRRWFRSSEEHRAAYP